MSLSPEDQARANFYGLIARLFYAAPDEQLMSELVRAPALEGEGALAAAWRDMVEVCRSAFPVTLENEHTELFVGTGKAEVTPYLTHYILKHAKDNPLVALRQQFAAWASRGAKRSPSTKITSRESARRCVLLLQCSTGRRKSRRITSSASSIAARSPFAMR